MDNLFLNYKGNETKKNIYNFNYNFYCNFNRGYNLGFYDKLGIYNKKEKLF